MDLEGRECRTYLSSSILFGRLSYFVPRRLDSSQYTSLDFRPLNQYFGFVPDLMTDDIQRSLVAVPKIDGEFSFVHSEGSRCS